MFCDNAIALAGITRLARAESQKEEKELQSAWLRIAGLPRDPPKEEDEDEDEDEAADDPVSLAAQAASHGRQGQGALGAGFRRAIVEFEEEIAREIRALEEHEGPFAYLRLPADLDEALSTPIHFACMGFRCLYGLELLATGSRCFGRSSLGRIETRYS